MTMTDEARPSASEEYWYDEAVADAAVTFFPTHLRFTDAEWAGKPFVLNEWEEHDIIRPLFGWKRKDGTRRYRRCFVWIPRKNGKTELAAGVSLLALLADGEVGGQVYSIATDKNQAKIVFDKAVTMVQWSPGLSRHLDCFKTSIWCSELSAAFKPLSGTPEGKHGLSMSGLVGDEIHEWRDGKLYTFLHQSIGARRQPIEFMISTAGERAGYGWEMWQYCLKVLNGEIDDQETLVVIYAADPDDDWTDEKVWAKANPNLGISPKIESLRAECQQARELPRLENDFKRYHLNMWTEQAVRWLPMDAWDECGHPVLPAEVAGSPVLALAPHRANERWKTLEEMVAGRVCYGGGDLSMTTDLTSYVLVFPPDVQGGLWIVVPRCFVPASRIEERVRRDKVDYDLWEKSGALFTTPGNVVDYSFVEQKIIEDTERFDLQKIGIDPFNATQFTLGLRAKGIDAQFYRQGYLSMSPPMKEIERLVLDRKIDHGGHPVLRWCAKNMAISPPDPAGNIKPAKDKATERIDAIVATINAFGMALGTPPPEPSVYEERGLLTLDDVDILEI